MTSLPATTAARAPGTRATAATRAATTRAAGLLHAIPGDTTDKVTGAAGRVADRIPALADLTDRVPALAELTDLTDRIPALADRIPALADRVVASEAARRLAATATKATASVMAGKAVAAGTAARAVASGMAKAVAAGTVANGAAASPAGLGQGTASQRAAGQAGTERVTTSPSTDDVGVGTTRSTGTTRSAGDGPRRSVVRWPAVAALAGWAAAGTGVWADARRFGDLVWDDAGIDRSRLPLLVASGPIGAAWYWSTIRPALTAAALGEATRGG